MTVWIAGSLVIGAALLLLALAPPWRPLVPPTTTESIDVSEQVRPAASEPLPEPAATPAAAPPHQEGARRAPRPAWRGRL